MPHGRSLATSVPKTPRGKLLSTTSPPRSYRKPHGNPPPDPTEIYLMSGHVPRVIRERGGNEPRAIGVGRPRPAGSDNQNPPKEDQWLTAHQPFLSRAPRPVWAGIWPANS